MAACNRRNSNNVLPLVVFHAVRPRGSGSAAGYLSRHRPGDGVEGGCLGGQGGVLVVGGGQGLGLAEDFLGGAQGDAGFEQQGRARVAS